MSSQPEIDEVLKPGVMVPLWKTFAFVDEDLVTALTTFYDPRSGHGRADSVTYALLPDGLPGDLFDTDELYFGAKFDRLRSEGSIVNFGYELGQISGLYRVDDDRPGQNLSYMVWLPPVNTKLSAPSLAPNRIYGCFPNGARDPKQVSEFPDSFTRAQFDDLLTEAGIEPITSPAQLADNPEAGSIIASTGLRVWDVGAMFRL